MPNLSAIESATTKAVALSNLVLVTPQSVIGYQPQNKATADGSPSLAQPPPSLLFHYEGEQTATLESDITDHFIEDNSAIQDQIALKPEVVTTHGFIGELNNVPPFALGVLKTAANKLTAIVAYEPETSLTAQLAYAEAFFAYQVAANLANSAVSAWNFATGGGGLSVIGAQGLAAESNQSKQQTAFQQFYGYWRNRTLFTVQTPWAVFQNMAIKSLRAIQSAETNVITDFEVSFKMIRNASTVSSLGTVSNTFQGQAQSQSAGLVDQGVSTPAPELTVGQGLSAMGIA